jgi:glycosyltransferase involved in cell wall biosynthesis
MKIRYILIHYDNDENGVLKKALNQTFFLKRIGVDIELILITSEKFSFESLNYVKIRQINRCNISNFTQRLKRARQIAGIMKKEIESLEVGDWLYLRYPYHLLVYPKNIIKNKRTCKVIFEHNTKEMEEFKLVYGIFSQSFIQELIFSIFLRSQSDAIIGVTDEITHYQLCKYHDPQKPHFTIGNGFDINSVILRLLPNYNGICLHLLCVANVSRWHGIDRLIEGLAAYNGPLKIILHIAGEGYELPHLKQMVTERKLIEQVIFHGFKSGNKLDSLFNICHIAIGSLGLHRIGLNESSTLKAREYCARGIPYIIACGDPDFPDDFPYILRVPPDESPIDIESVVHFAQKVCADSDHPKKMRKYAEENLDWSIKMMKLKGFLESLIEDRSLST